MKKHRLTVISDIVANRIPLGSVVVGGWLRTRRDTKSFSFLELNDGSSSRSIQIIADSKLENYESAVKSLTMGASLECEGDLVVSKGKGQTFEIVASKITVLGTSEAETYPLQKKEMSYEYLRENAHLRARTSTFASVFRIRSRVAKIIHDFFELQGFFYVHPPVISTAECEGGVIPFQVTTLPLANLPRLENGAVDYSKDFFGHPALLSGSGQLQGELLALALGKIYTFAPTFRAENSNTSRHLAEFWQIEPEMAFYDLDDTIRLVQGLIKNVIERFLVECKDDIEVVIARNGTDPRANLETVLTSDLSILSYTEAIAILKNSNRRFSFPVEWGCDLQTEHERFLCEEHFKGPTVVYNYPADLKSFYMYFNDDHKTVAGADILVPGIGEIVGSSQREHRLDVLRERMLVKGMKVQNYEWYLSTRRFGTVPHSGFGMGFERLLAWLTGMENIRDVIPFPRSTGNCLF